jgi:hypothetical protein
MERLAQELRQQQVQSRHLEDVIAQNLEALGYGG